MRYFRRPWDESRGDQFDAWGTSIWYLEVGDDLGIRRQVEVYANGTVLTYDEGHFEDAFGRLGEGTLDPEDDGYLPFEIERAEFERAWQMPAKNR